MDKLLTAGEWGSAAIVLIFGVLIARTFAPIMFNRDRGALWHLGLFIAFWAGATAARGLYWSGEPWGLRGIVPKEVINVTFNLIFARGCWHLLVAMWLYLPDDRRAAYRWWTAPWYPREVQLTVAAARLLETLRFWRRSP